MQDERDSHVTWQAAGPGVRVGGSVRLPKSLTWRPWKGAHSTLNGAFVADIGAALPPHVVRAIAAASGKRRNATAAEGHWDYGQPPPLINQLYVHIPGNFYVKNQPMFRCSRACFMDVFYSRSRWATRGRSWEGSPTATRRPPQASASRVRSCRARAVGRG